jgi:division protein CdvB (Snf7/Vps24/ESCRT-III family)
MSFLFGGGRPSQNDTIKHYQREINRHVRSMERESLRSLQNDKPLLNDIKKYVQKNDLHMATLKAKELIRARNFRKRLCTTQQGLVALGQQLSIISTSQQSQEVLAKTTRILHALNTKMDLTSTYKMLRGFEEQSVLLDEKTEVINETMDGIFEVDNGEIDGTLSSVFEEIGLDLHKLMDNNKTNTLQMQESQDNIEERFARLVANK